jgi:hypothetical protein
MAVYDVNFTIPERTLGNTDVEFNVKSDGSKLGTLKISKGHVVWVPANKQKGSKMRWKQFDILMQEHGTLER